jgi:hypothetical protein
VKKEHYLWVKTISLYQKLRRCCTGAKMVLTSPSKALPKALDKAGIALSDVEYFNLMRHLL